MTPMKIESGCLYAIVTKYPFIIISCKQKSQTSFDAYMLSAEGVAKNVNLSIPWYEHKALICKQNIVGL